MSEEVQWDTEDGRRRVFFFFNDTATTEIYTLSLHDALPIYMNIEEHSFTEAVRAAATAGRLGYVHVGESHRGALGTGSIPWTEFFTALDEVDYSGIVTFESFSSEVVHRTLSNDLAIWRNLWTDNQALARDALAFTKAGLAEAASRRGVTSG